LKWALDAVALLTHLASQCVPRTRPEIVLTLEHD
jgi:hypothetical protein